MSYHEVGHATGDGALQKNTEPVQKITIVPQYDGSARLHVMQTPEEEKYLQTKDELLANDCQLTWQDVQRRSWYSTVGNQRCGERY